MGPEPYFRGAVWAFTDSFGRVSGLGVAKTPIHAVEYGPAESLPKVKRSLRLSH